MPRKVKLILNPMADMGRAWKTANNLRPIAQEFKGELSWSGTVYPSHAIELARQAAEEGYDMVIAMGGDGTVHEVMSGLMQVPAEKRPIMGIVPIGSGNDFAYAVGITQKPDHALAHALNAEVKLTKISINISTIIKLTTNKYYQHRFLQHFGSCLSIRFTFLNRFTKKSLNN